jgi:hypothetical protein
MIIDCNYKDKNKDFSKKTNDVTGYPNFVCLVVENRNNYHQIDLKNPSITETENPFTMTGLITAIIDDLDNLRKKIEFLEKKVLSQHYGNFLVKEKNSKNDE